MDLSLGCLLCVVCAGVVAYVYLGYPLLLWLLSTVRRGQSLETMRGSAVGNWPTVSLVVPAYNEESVIAHKIENTCALDYAKDRLELIVVSDGSTDETEELARACLPGWGKLLVLETRRGKASALNRALAEAEGEIVVLSDANAFYESDAISRLVAGFADPGVGAVTGEVRLLGDDASYSQSEGLYYRYERFIQLCESRIASVIGVDGALYAIRRELYQPLHERTVVDDFVVGMRVAQSGYRIIYEPRAVGYERTSPDWVAEFRRKSRVIAGGLQSVFRGWALPRPWQLCLLWQLVSHKLLRWLVPLFLLMLLVGSAVCQTSLPAQVAFVAQVLFYGLAIAAWRVPGQRVARWMSIPYYFVLMNLAALWGLGKAVSGRQPAAWERVR